MTGDVRDPMVDHLREGRFEAVVETIKSRGAPPRRSDFKPIIQSLTARAAALRAKGETGRARGLERRIRALVGLRDHGPDPARMIAEVELPEGCNGKILMASISGGVVEGLVCLRSGDEWHREILRNTEKEILDLGFGHSRVYSLGGAHARFESDGAIRIWGASDEYGACDKELAAEMIRRAFPGRRVRVD
ncbi:MAG: hypothetical protein GY859_19510 [Desulfobacterales bacterium]|nr:hypothetical protein [Desulfobacterales bacterium]